MTEPSTERRFILLMTETRGDWDAQEPEEIEALLGRYFAWVDGLAQEGIFQGGEGLYSEGSTVRVVDGQTVDGPFAETKELIAGFFLVEVEDRGQAVALAESCPALTHGRSIWVAPWSSEAGGANILSLAPREGCFMLLCYEEPAAAAGLTPQQQQGQMVAQMKWVEALRSQGILRYAEPIEPPVARWTPDGLQSQGFPDAAVAALYAFEAEDMDAALSIARRCPALERGATLEVQPIWHVDAQRTT